MTQLAAIFKAVSLNRTAVSGRAGMSQNLKLQFSHTHLRAKIWGEPHPQRVLSELFWLCVEGLLVCFNTPPR